MASTSTLSDVPLEDLASVVLTALLRPSEEKLVDFATGPALGLAVVLVVSFSAGVLLYVGVRTLTLWPTTLLCTPCRCRLDRDAYSFLVVAAAAWREDLRLGTGSPLESGPPGTARFLGGIVPSASPTRRAVMLLLPPCVCDYLGVARHDDPR